ncbi:MAG TPA: FAD-dependent oxidoreductase [Acidobacteriaceae bacterium]|nr:FAD-dependent oxidoreductase [Acidobacteriaceae bacterium]
MAKPILLVVDDDQSVLDALLEDLRRHYGSRYSMVRANSGKSALEVSTELKKRGDTVALLLSDQRMPGISGVELLEKSIGIFPAAKRVLLTAYADTDAAIRAINTAKIHYYLTKPWDPPEEKLYAVLDDLLEAWNQDYRAPFEGLRVIGTRWSSNGHEIRNFLSRNHVPYRWIDPSAESAPPDGVAQHGKTEAATLLEQYKLEPTKLPVVLFTSGEALVQPEIAELGAKVGLRTLAERDFYDLVIVGAGPAGLGAAVYGASEGLKTLVIEPAAPGGQAGSSSRIENYLGFPAGLTGSDLARRATIQATRFGAEFLTQRATGIRTEGQYQFIQLLDGREVACHCALIATGVEYRKLDAPGLEELSGAGVYYGAALTEAISCTGEHVFIVGGANSAGQAAMHFTQYCSQVTMLVRASSLEKGMSSYLVEQIAANPKIEVLPNTEVIGGCARDGHLYAIRLRTPQGEREERASALFIFVGGEPKTDWLPSEILRDSRGFVLSGSDLPAAGKAFVWKLDRPPYLLETSVPGVFVAGDVRHGSTKRVASAVGEGSIVIPFVHEYLAKF